MKSYTVWACFIETRHWITDNALYLTRRDALESLFEVEHPYHNDPDETPFTDEELEALSDDDLETLMDDIFEASGHSSWVGEGTLPEGLIARIQAEAS
jgi:hypothetical protein